MDGRPFNRAKIRAVVFFKGGESGLDVSIETGGGDIHRAEVAKCGKNDSAHFP